MAQATCWNCGRKFKPTPQQVVREQRGQKIVCGKKDCGPAHSRFRKRVEAANLEECLEIIREYGQKVAISVYIAPSNTTGDHYRLGLTGASNTKSMHKMYGLGMLGSYDASVTMDMLLEDDETTRKVTGMWGR